AAALAVDRRAVRIPLRMAARRIAPAQAPAIPAHLVSPQPADRSHAGAAPCAAGLRVRLPFDRHRAAAARRFLPDAQPANGEPGPRAVVPSPVQGGRLAAVFVRKSDRAGRTRADVRPLRQAGRIDRAGRPAAAAGRTRSLKPPVPTLGFAAPSANLRAAPRIAATRATREAHPSPGISATPTGHSANGK